MQQQSSSSSSQQQQQQEQQQPLVASAQAFSSAVAAKNRATAEYQRARNKLCEVFEQHLGYDVDEYAGAALADVQIMRDQDALDMLLDRRWVTVAAADTADGPAVRRVSEPAAARVFVHFSTGKTMPNYITALIARLVAERAFVRADTLVVVLAAARPGKVVAGGSRALRQAVDAIWDSAGYRVVVHDLAHLQYNALRNREHQPVGLRVLSPEERESFLRESGMHPNDLPKISCHSVVPALLCARVGDVIYGERASPTTILAPEWRLVTADHVGPKSSSKGGGGARAAAERD
jgi:DNA-directed RNA polymerase subunit H (RpoH/RPB5)